MNNNQLQMFLDIHIYLVEISGANRPCLWQPNQVVWIKNDEGPFRLAENYQQTSMDTLT